MRKMWMVSAVLRNDETICKLFGSYAQAAAYAASVKSAHPGSMPEVTRLL